MNLRQVGILLCSALLLPGCTDEGAEAEDASKDSRASQSTRPNAANASLVRVISTSAWKPGDPGRTALIRGSMGFTAEGCPYLGYGRHRSWAVLPADYAVTSNDSGGFQLITADGRSISEGDRIRTGGAAVSTRAEAGMPCIPEGKWLTLIQAEVEITPGR